MVVEREAVKVIGYVMFFFLSLSSCRLGWFHLLKSYLGSLGNIMDDSGLLELIQLIYPGSTMANHILNGGCFDKANREKKADFVGIYFKELSQET